MKKKKIKTGWILFMVLVVTGSVLFTGCSGGDDYLHNDDKYNRYVEFNNDIIQLLNFDLQSYGETFGLEEKQNVSKDFKHFGINPVIETFYKSCDNIIEDSKKKPVIEGLDASAATLAEKTKKLYDIINEMADYYNNDKCLKDNFAKGKEIHTKWISFLKEYDKDFSAFARGLSKMEVPQLKKALGQYANGKNDYEYYALKCIIDGENISSYLYDNGINDENILKLKSADFEKLRKEIADDYKAFQKAVSESQTADFRGQVMEQQIGLLTFSTEHIKLIVDAQDINVKIPGVSNKGQVVSAEVTPVSDLDSYLSGAITYYNNRG